MNRGPSDPPGGPGGKGKRPAEPPWWTAAKHEYPLSEMLSPEDAADLRAIGRRVDVARRGGILFRQGDPASDLYVIEKGVVAIYRELAGGERQTVAFHYAGDICGLAEDGRYVNTAEALTPVRATKFRFGALADLLASHPTLDLHLLVKAAHDLRSAQRQILILGRHSADDRLATMIALLIQGGVFFDRATRTLVLPMSRQHMADFLALTPETLARSLHRLEAHGAIRRLSPSKIRIRDEAFFQRRLSML